MPRLFITEARAAAGADSGHFRIAPPPVSRAITGTSALLQECQTTLQGIPRPFQVFWQADQLALPFGCVQTCSLFPWSLVAVCRHSLVASMNQHCLLLVSQLTVSTDLR
eukprot:6195980-Pleurochrysis_carterae.AAC.2